MKVRISYTVDVSDETRRAINRYYGYPGLASREEIQRWYRNHGQTMNDDLVAETEPDEEEEES